MKVVLTKDLSDALLKRPKDEVRGFIDKVDRIKDSNKTEIISLDSVVKLTNVDNRDVYAYNIDMSAYILFVFMPKKTMLLLDVIELTDDNKIKSLAYSQHIVDN